jgi:hypothetical protein
MTASSSSRNGLFREAGGWPGGGAYTGPNAGGAFHCWAGVHGAWGVQWPCGVGESVAGAVPECGWLTYRTRLGGAM